MKEFFIIYDKNVEPFAKELCKAWQEEEGVVLLGSLAIDADEQHKTLQNAEEICKWLLSKGADRHALLCAVGGGVTLDLVGFVAGIYKRGVKFICVPTTLLSQVDASLGGKNGVNLDGYKNVLGVFLDPQKTMIYEEPLLTLDRESYLSGAGEMLKTFIIGSGRLYERAISLFTRFNAAGYSLEAVKENIDELMFLVKEAAKIKCAIVKKDKYDLGKRKVLNLGHTYGHAIEWWQQTEEGLSTLESRGQKPMAHGQAVAIGTIRSAELSERENICRKGLKDKLVADYKACGLPTELPCSAADLTPSFLNDKKMDGDVIDYVYIKSIGHVTMAYRSVDEII